MSQESENASISDFINYLSTKYGAVFTPVLDTNDKIDPGWFVLSAVGMPGSELHCILAISAAFPNAIGPVINHDVSPPVIRGTTMMPSEMQAAANHARTLHYI